MITSIIENDSRIAQEAKLQCLARVIGYTHIGEPVELVFFPKTENAPETYEWHVAGESVGEASDELVVKLLQSA